MRIIIVGNGKVGYAIANSLAEEEHDIIIVDAHTAALRKAESTMDVLCVEGNGASISVLDAAGVCETINACCNPYQQAVAVSNLYIRVG